MSKSLFLLLGLLFLGMQPNNYTLARKRMINEQIIARGITDKSTINAFELVERHKFVPPDLAMHAYEDRPLSIGFGQTISQPYIVAYMTQILNLSPEDKVLEVGTGSGYQAAILSEIVKQVYTIEIVKPLGEEAADRLKELDYTNVSVKIGDGYNGWPEYAPFDAIMVTAGAESIPEPLIDQLKEGGRMIIPVGGKYDTQYLIFAQKKNGKMKTYRMLPVRFVPFTRSKE